MKGILLLILLFCYGCHHAQQITKYDGNVGETSFDPKLDDKNFTLCNEAWVAQYFHFTSNPNQVDNKALIDSIFFRGFKGVTDKKQNGLIRIRFIVNCKGETGRFRVLGMDPNYQEKSFPESIVSPLLSITKNLRIWPGQRMKDSPIDYYQYLIFKITDGQLTEILP